MAACATEKDAIEAGGARKPDDSMEYARGIAYRDDLQDEQDKQHKAVGDSLSGLPRSTTQQKMPAHTSTADGQAAISMRAAKAVAEMEARLEKRRR